MKTIYDELSIKISKQTTQKYSTSFSLGIKLLDSEIRNLFTEYMGLLDWLTKS